MKRKKMTVKEAVKQSLPRISEAEVDAAGSRVWKNIEAALEKRKDSLAWRSLYGDGWTVPALDQPDLQILTAAQMLGERATRGRILSTLKAWMERPPVVSIGLDRLVAAKLLSVGGGLYRLTEMGEGALHRARVEEKVVVPGVAELRVPSEEELEAGLETE